MYIQPRYYSVSKNNSQRWVALSLNPHPSEEASDQLCPVDPYLKSRRSPNLQMSLATLPLTSWGHFTPDGRGTHTVPYQGGPASGWHAGFVARGACCPSVATLLGLRLSGALPRHRGAGGGGGTRPGRGGEGLHRWKDRQRETRNLWLRAIWE